MSFWWLETSDDRLSHHVVKKDKFIEKNFSSVIMSSRFFNTRSSGSEDESGDDTPVIASKPAAAVRFVENLCLMLLCMMLMTSAFCSYEASCLPPKQQIIPSNFSTIVARMYVCR